MHLKELTSVQSLSSLHHDKHLLPQGSRYSRGIRRLEVSYHSGQFVSKDHICEVKVLILDKVMEVLISEHRIVFECSVHSLYLLLSDHQQSRYVWCPVKNRAHYMRSRRV